MRVAVGDEGRLEKALPCLCCRITLPAGLLVYVHSQHSPKRVWVGFRVPGVKLGRRSGPLSDLEGSEDRIIDPDGEWLPNPTIPWPWAHRIVSRAGTGRMEPPFYAIHKVKASKVWFAERVAQAILADLG